MKKKWWKNAVIYEIYCRSFKDTDGDGIGDLRGVLEKLPYLHDLGVDCLWFTPIYVSPQVDNGYDVADYRNIAPEYGDNALFKELIDKAHSLGIKIIMDMVLNHSSSECEWFKKSRESTDNPYRDYYYWRKPKPDGTPPNNWGNYFKEGDGSAWEFDEKTGEYYLHLYSIKMPDLNWESKALRKEIYSMMNGWLDMGVDGFRLDVITKIKKPSGLPDSFEEKFEGTPYYRFGCDCVEGFHGFINELRENTWGKEKYDAFAIGETPGIHFPDDFRALLSPERKELDLLYHFFVARRIGSAETGIKNLKKMQPEYAKLLKEGIWPTNHLSTHDQPRQVSKFGNDKRYRVRSAKALATLIHTLPGTPIIYQGEELGMCNTYFDSIEQYNDRYTLGDYGEYIKLGDSPETAIKKVQKSSRDNARTPMQWDSTENAGFTTGTPWLGINKNYKTINAEKAVKDKKSVYNFYKSLIKMRKKFPAFIDGDITFLSDIDDPVIFFMRKCPEQTLFVTLNLSSKKQDFRIPEKIAGKTFTSLLSNLDTKKVALTSHTLLPYEAVIYEEKR